MIYYFDNAASTKPYPEVISYLSELLETEYANPSALHKFGYEVSKLTDTASENLKRLYKLNNFDVIFTSGATESVNMAIKGTVARFSDITKTHIITTPIEHACVSETFSYLASKGVGTSYVKIDKFGKIDIDDLKSKITDKTKLVSVIWVNNETGIIQDIEKIAKAIKEKNHSVLFHIDATQGFGKISGDISCADLISISAHKFHGPKGIGALFVKKGVNLNCVLHGGGQQNNLRSGTINAPMIAAMGKACELINIENINSELSSLQKYLYDKIEENFGKDVINTLIYDSNYAPHIMSLSFTSLKGEVILHMLEDKNIYVATSSACSAHKKKKSVLENLGFSSERIGGTIRISLCEFTTKDEIDYLVANLTYAVNLLKNLRG